MGKNKKKLPQDKKLYEKYNADRFPPRFSFRMLVKDDKFGFEGMEKDHKLSLINTIYKLSQLNWADLRIADRHGLGYEIIERHALSLPIPISVPDHVKIIAFRYHGKASMLGYRSIYGTFYIIAIGRNFQAYKH